jgi:hypothetical protein
MNNTTTTPRKLSTRVPTRTKQLRDIHELARKAGHDTRGEVGDPRRESYERFLQKTIGRTSTRQAVRSEREAVIHALKKQTDAGYRMANAKPVEVVSDDEALGVL